MKMDPAGEFSELIRHCGDKAYNFAYRLAGNDQDARDLVQEAFSRAYAHFGSYDPARSFETWLLRILHNIYLDGVRRYAHGHTVSLDAPAPVEESSWEELLPAPDRAPTADIESRETDAQLQRALAAVPAHYRAAVLLCDVEGLSYEQIAKIMACPVGTVRSRIHQGRVLIKKEYEKLENGGKAS